MAIELTDDGTLDTVLRCSECGEEFRFNYASQVEFNSDPEERDDPDPEKDYELFIQGCIEDVENDHECPADPDAEPTEPQEDDLTTSDHETFYQSGERVLQIIKQNSFPSGKPVSEWWFLDHGKWNGLGDFKEDYKAALRAYMERTQFWPNAWFISDHGNAHLIDLTEDK